MAFPVATASALTGASVSQLHNWRRTDLLVPETDPEPRHLLYSFRDLLALRTVVKLRQGNSLQRIRRAFRYASEVDLTEHPSQWTLVDTGGSIILNRDGDQGIDVLAHPGQTTLANLADVMAPFETERGPVVDLVRPRPHLQVREQRLGGFPTIENTRVPFDVVANLLADGSVSIEDVPRYYPSVTPSAAADALDFARSIPNWSDELASA